MDTNSGVHANVGFDFQRNTCVYILLENYDALKDLRYFIMLEHYDDIVFGLTNGDGDLTKVVTYQAKKSSTPWKNNQVYPIIEKICKVAANLLKDDLKKAKSYRQSHYFITNNTIKIEYKCSITKKNKNVYINESNEVVKFSDLSDDCKLHILKGSESVTFDQDEKQHLQNLNFQYIDLGRSTKSQLDLLTGKFKTVFGETILDHQAARDTLIYRLKEIESIFNQNDLVKLNDNKKRIESHEISRIFNILTTKKLALDFCRKKSDSICTELLISVFDATSFELNFENSLDKFKDLTQGEHQKILQFVESKSYLFHIHTSATDCIGEIYKMFVDEKNSTLLPLQLKASLSAAYFLILNK